MKTKQVSGTFTNLLQSKFNSQEKSLRQNKAKTCHDCRI